MPGGRRITRASTSPPVKHNNSNFIFPGSSPHNNMAQQAAEERLGPVIPEMKHIRLPPLRRESTLCFEIIILLHVLLFTSLQFLHLYRTVWWLPQSFNSSGMNFHLIDWNIVVFILALLGRRIPYLIIKSLLPNSQRVLSILMTSITCTWLVLTTLRLWSNSNLSPYQLLYLYGPLLLHVHVYGANIKSVWEIEELDHPLCETAYSHTPSTTRFQYHHLCTNDPTAIRNECEMLRKEFNTRLKGVLTQSVLIAYYSSFIPWCFVQPYVMYDVGWVMQHLLLSWTFLFGLLVSRALCPDFSDGLHKAACHLGRWAKLRPTHIPSNTWTGDYLFVPGAIAKHQRELYKAEGMLCVASEPGNKLHSRFQMVFSGSTFSKILLGYHLSVMLLSLLILIRTIEWYKLISISALILTSSHTFIRLARDFLVVWKMYQAEDMILRQQQQQCHHLHNN